VEDNNAQPGKPYFLMYYAEGWGGWRGLRRDSLNDDPAEFDTVEEGRKLAQSAAVHNHFRTRVVELATGTAVAEYRSDGVQVK